LKAVVTLPSGVFKPYAGVSTAILLFTKVWGAKDKVAQPATEHVWFYEMAADGYSLDDKRTPQADKNDLPDLAAQWKARDPKKPSDRTARHFFVPVSEIQRNNYDLSLNRYKETKHEEAVFEKPKVILGKLRELEMSIVKDINELEEMLS
jgi:type I restriction enzyme M protein